VVSGEQVLTIAGGDDEPITLDPALIRDAGSSFLARQIFRGLVRLDDNLQAQPDLAQRIEILEGGLAYRFHLRENAVFHDGSPINAVAVADSLDRACDPDLAGGDGFALPAAIYLIDIVGVEERLRGDADRVEGITVVNDYVLEIRLRQPVASFLYKLSGNPAQIVDVVSIDSDDWWVEPNGSGPFILHQLDTSRIVLRRFDRFYDGAPLLAEVRILLGAASASPLNLYEAGDVDYTEVPFHAIDRVLSDSDPLHDDLVVVPQLSTSFVMLNPNLAPFDSVDVREAIVRAFDRHKVAKVMLDGKVREASGLVPPGIMDREWPGEPPGYDVAAARTALASAGNLELRPAFYGSGVNVALKLVLERDLGLESDAISLEWSQFSERLSDQSLPAFVLSWIADFPDPANFLTAMFHSASPDNYLSYSNPAVDELLDAAEVETEVETRASLYLQAQQLILDDAVLIPLYHDVSYSVVQPWVRGLHLSPVGILSFEDVWIER
jgi:peptide/nickel transport system substrate-binding protein/oligopeptide transport system substrate-binding protein